MVAPGELGLLRRAARPHAVPHHAGRGRDHLPDGADAQRLTCFWGFCEVLPDRVNILAEIGERAEDIDVARAEAARDRAAAR